MPRNMSFFLTIQQVKKQTKTVTRRQRHGSQER